MKEEITLKQVYEKVIALDARMAVSSSEHKVSFNSLKVLVYWLMVGIITDIALSGISIIVHLNSK